MWIRSVVTAGLMLCHAQAVHDAQLPAYPPSSSSATPSIYSAPVVTTIVAGRATSASDSEPRGPEADIEATYEVDDPYDPAHPNDYMQWRGVSGDDGGREVAQLVGCITIDTHTRYGSCSSRANRSAKRSSNKRGKGRRCRGSLRSRSVRCVCCCAKFLGTNQRLTLNGLQRQRIAEERQAAARAGDVSALRSIGRGAGRGVSNLPAWMTKGQEDTAGSAAPSTGRERADSAQFEDAPPPARGENVGARMMSQMGYREGEGLGRTMQVQEKACGDVSPGWVAILKCSLTVNCVTFRCCCFCRASASRSRCRRRADPTGG